MRPLSQINSRGLSRRQLAPTHNANKKVAMRSSLRTLDSQHYGSWPWTIKLLLIALSLLAIAAIAYALPISSKLQQIAAAEAEQQTLREVYREKESKARHLAAYKAQMQQMETEFNVLLDQLPKDTRVSDLVEGINMTGINSGIRFKDITIEPEIEQDVFVEQPIRIEAVGDYHQFGAFLSRLAKLPRIITMHDFTVVNSKPSLDTRPELNLVLNTMTYRSKEQTVPVNSGDGDMDNVSDTRESKQANINVSGYDYAKQTES